MLECPRCGPRRASATDVLANLSRPRPIEQWGDIAIAEDSSTPWGAAQDVNYIAQGCASASGPRHGGIKLSRERNAAIPKPLRRANGWYEEDCEANIVFAFHPDIVEALSRNPDRMRADAVRSCREWFPDEWEAATGEPVSDEESGKRREQRERETYRHMLSSGSRDHAVVAAGAMLVRTGRDPVTDIAAIVPAKVPGEEDVRHFLVPRGDVRFDDNRIVAGGWTIDRSAHMDVTDLVKVGERPPAKPKVVLKGDELRLADRADWPDAAQRWFDKLWRFDEGVMSAGEHLLRYGAVSKRKSYFNGSSRPTYWVDTDGTGRITKVPKAVWDALEGLPNGNSDVDNAAFESSRLEAQLDKVARGSAKAAELEKGIEQARRDRDAALAASREDMRSQGWLPSDEREAEIARRVRQQVSERHGWGSAGAERSAWEAMRDAGLDPVGHPEAITRETVELLAVIGSTGGGRST